MNLVTSAQQPTKPFVWTKWQPASNLKLSIPTDKCGVYEVQYNSHIVEIGSGRLSRLPHLLQNLRPTCRAKHRHPASWVLGARGYTLARMKVRWIKTMNNDEALLLEDQLQRAYERQYGRLPEGNERHTIAARRRPAVARRCYGTAGVPRLKMYYPSCATKWGDSQ